MSSSLLGLYNIHVLPCIFGSVVAYKFHQPQLLLQFITSGLDVASFPDCPGNEASLDAKWGSLVKFYEDSFIFSMCVHVHTCSLPLAQCKQKFSAMEVHYRENLKQWIDDSSRKFGWDYLNTATVWRWREEEDGS